MVMKIEKTTVVLVAETRYKRTLNLFLIRPQKDEDGRWRWKKGAMEMKSGEKSAKRPPAKYFVWIEDADKKVRGYEQPTESRQAALEAYNKALVYLESMQYRETHGNAIGKEQETFLLLVGYIKRNYHLNKYEWIDSPLHCHR